MGNVVDFQRASLDVALRKVLDGKAPPVSEEQAARYAAEGVALIRKESGVTPDNVFTIMASGVMRCGIKRR